VASGVSEITDDLASRAREGGWVTSPYTVGYVVGSISSTSLNRRLGTALERLAPEADLRLIEIPIVDLPFYNSDFEAPGADHPAAVSVFRERLAEVDAVLIITPEYNRSVPGVLKNALDWASRPTATAPLRGKPSYVVGASPGQIGTAVAQQHLRSILSFLASPELAQPEVYLQAKPGSFGDDGTIAEERTAILLRKALTAFHDHIARNLRGHH
jgi:chromate reductase